MSILLVSISKTLIEIQPPHFQLGPKDHVEIFVNPGISDHRAS